MLAHHATCTVGTQRDIARYKRKTAIHEPRLDARASGLKAPNGPFAGAGPASHLVSESSITDRSSSAVSPRIISIPMRCECTRSRSFASGHALLISYARLVNMPDADH